MIRPRIPRRGRLVQGLLESKVVYIESRHNEAYNQGQVGAFQIPIGVLDAYAANASTDAAAESGDDNLPLERASESPVAFQFYLPNVTAMDGQGQQVRGVIRHVRTTGEVATVPGPILFRCPDLEALVAPVYEYASIYSFDNPTALANFRELRLSDLVERNVVTLRLNIFRDLHAPLHVYTAQLASQMHREIDLWFQQIGQLPHRVRLQLHFTSIYRDFTRLDGLASQVAIRDYAPVVTFAEHRPSFNVELRSYVNDRLTGERRMSRVFSPYIVELGPWLHRATSNAIEGANLPPIAVPGRYTGILTDQLIRIGFTGMLRFATH